MKKNIRNDFPFFAHCPVVYLDNAATTHKPQQVIQAMVDFYTLYNAPVKRGLYATAEKATQLYESARQTVANFIGAQSDEIVFVKNATEGINFVATAWAMEQLVSGDEIVLTELEHHANLVVWQQIAQKKNIIIKYISVDQEGILQLNSLETLITAKTKLVAFLAVSHVLGAHLPVSLLVKRARAVGAKVLIDAAQWAPHCLIDVKKVEPDFVVFSCHKMLGPTGVGILYIKKAVQQEVRPYQFGGGMIFDVSYQKATFLEPPHCYEAGTQPVAQVIGFAAALNYLKENVDFDQLQTHEAFLCQLFIETIEKSKKIKVLGNKNELSLRGHLVSFIHDTIHFHDLAAILDHHGIAVRSGNYCAQPLSERLQINGSVRASFYCYTTAQEVLYAAKIIASL